MIIAPLVFSTLVVGIAHMEDTAAIGRVGVKTLGWFMLASLVSLTLGLIMVHLLQPGAGLALPPPPRDAGVATAGFSLKDFITHLVPTSIFDAMARNEILQIVVFSVFVGTAVAALDGKAPLLLDGLRAGGRGDAEDHRLCDGAWRRWWCSPRWPPPWPRPGWASSWSTPNSSAASISRCAALDLAARLLQPGGAGAGSGRCSRPSASRSCWPFPPPPRKPPIPICWRACRSSACRAGSSASCCRWAIPSTWTAR